ncbi:MAG: TraB/GumN family protein [Deltaproteobacteria bacterium]|nr:TraB/GumN family protein [Deltaproteobacteria bacterium]
MINNDNTHHLNFEDKKITLIGTAHVSIESADLVQKVIEDEKPDMVCVELCESRYQSIMQKSQWQNTNLLKVIKEKKAFLLLSNLMLAYFQKKIGQKLGIRPGEEIVRAIQVAKSVGARIHLADRDIRTTLSRLWRCMGLWAKIKLLFQLVTSVGEMDSIKEADIEEMKKKDVLEMFLSEVGKSFPEIRRILIDERDQYLAHMIRTAPGKKIVAVVGAGHIPGIQSYWERHIDLDALNQIPPKGKVFGFLKWGIPSFIVCLIILGFFYAGSSAGTDMIKWWVLANAILAGLGAAIALGHPLTILSAIVASPLTSLNPMIAAGWVAGLVEVFLGKPKVKDFERLSEDISSLKGFWKNKITRILLVVAFTNIGSSVGTFVAIPLMVKVFA